MDEKWDLVEQKYKLINGDYSAGLIRASKLVFLADLQGDEERKVNSTFFEKSEFAQKASNMQAKQQVELFETYLKVQIEFAILHYVLATAYWQIEAFSETCNRCNAMFFNLGQIAAVKYLNLQKIPSYKQGKKGNSNRKDRGWELDGVPLKEWIRSKWTAYKAKGHLGDSKFEVWLAQQPDDYFRGSKSSFAQVFHEWLKKEQICFTSDGGDVTPKYRTIYDSWLKGL